MNPIAMTLLLSVTLGVFAWSAVRRWRLMLVGGGAPRWDRIGERVRATIKYAFAQERMRRYPLAGAAHILIFGGFMVLLFRSLILFSRGYVPDSDLLIFGHDHLFGQLYSLAKDVFIVLVMLGTLVFFYFRLLAKLKRMTMSGEALVILGIIFVMMVADGLYDGAARAMPVATMWAQVADAPAYQDDKGIWHSGSMVLPPPKLVAFRWYEPIGSLVARPFFHRSVPTVEAAMHVGFWTHVSLVLIFLNILPYSKHFHVITAIPNVFFQSLEPRGRLAPITDIEGKVEREETLGIKRIAQFDWKSVLDFYTCTECGRCSDHCPAANTGKKLSPKHFTIDLRNFLYKHGASLTSGSNGQGSTGDGDSAAEHQKDLVDGVIDPEVLWACTTCRACETECPVFITYVDKIVDMRRYLVQERGEFPGELQSAFRGLESNMNPWGFAPDERANWADGLDVPLLAEKGSAEYLFWVGCAPSYDDRAKKTARATAQLLKRAGVDFAILGAEESCTGDPARRAGNEFLFQTLAQANCQVLNGYKVKKIVTTCPHCFNTLRNEYPDFDGRFEVVHHTELLSQLVRDGRLTPTAKVDAQVTYHDSCYLGRYNDVYDAPRDLLRAIPGVSLVEPHETRDRGMCCGAGGAQMFKEEEHGDARVNVRRTEQLLATGSNVIASACPFCLRMLTDGLAGKERTDVEQLDIAEMLMQSMKP